MGTLSFYIYFDWWNDNIATPVYRHCCICQILMEQLQVIKQIGIGVSNFSLQTSDKCSFLRTGRSLSVCVCSKCKFRRAAGLERGAVRAWIVFCDPSTGLTGGILKWFAEPSVGFVGKYNGTNPFPQCSEQYNIAHSLL